MRKFWLSLIGLTILFAGISFGQGPLTNALNLMVRTDSNGSLSVYGVPAGAQGPLTNFGNIRLRTYGGGDLGVTLASGSTWTCTQNAIAVTSTDCFIATNTTAATGTTTVQMSPRLRFRGNAWDTAASQTVDFFMENLPATAATPTGTFKLGYSLNGAAASYPLTVSSAGITNVISGGSYGFAGVNNGMSLNGTSTAIRPADGGAYFNVANQLVQVNSATLQLASGGVGFNNIVGQNTAKLVQVLDVTSTTGMEFNNGTPTLGTCTGGSLTSGSHNFGGEVTGNTSGSCVLNFGTPNFTNTPFCMLNDESSLTAVRISARSASSITITGVPSGEAVQYFCIGRIGV